MRNSLKKQERLRGTAMIRELFVQGNSFLVHPYRVSWMIAPGGGNYPARILVGVSRKNFRKASDRNYLKRLTREAYRKNKHELYQYLEKQNIGCRFSVIYVAKALTDQATADKKIIMLLQRLISELEKQLSNIKHHTTNENT